VEGLYGFSSIFDSCFWLEAKLSQVEKGRSIIFQKRCPYVLQDEKQKVKVVYCNELHGPYHSPCVFINL
jgi:hypothetical protein